METDFRKKPKANNLKKKQNQLLSPTHPTFISQVIEWKTTGILFPSLAHGLTWELESGLNLTYKRQVA